MCAFLAFIGIFQIAIAETTQTELRAVTFVAPPFVIEHGDKLTGFSIDIWDEIAARLNVKTVYEKALTPGAGLDALRSKKVDLGISAILMTAARDREFDFSQPILESGQQVMIRAGRDTVTGSPLKDLLRLLFSSTTMAWLGIAVLLVFIPAHVIWLLERRDAEGVIPNDRYFPGIFHAAYWSVSTLLCQAQQMPRRWLARIIAILWMFTSVVFIALYTAQLTTFLTVQQIHGAINGPEDLPGKPVGTLAETVSVAYLREQNAKVVEFGHLEDMFKALLAKKVDALLLNAATLRYYESHDGRGLVEVVGPEFKKGQLGIAFPEGSPWRRRVNNALLTMHEDGTYQRIEERWFGRDTQ
ncbi:MAG: transporter substrate-binding domain-containing protein [Proteobacteria bacterium]|nr:transporter substrate-binding domain-containing protein [Pseudomonadota bacterium]